MSKKNVRIVDRRSEADYKVYFVTNRASEKNANLLYDCTLLKPGITDDWEYNHALKLFITNNSFDADICILKENFPKASIEKSTWISLSSILPKSNTAGELLHKYAQEKEKDIKASEPKEYERFVLAPIDRKGAIRWILCFTLIAFVLAIILSLFIGKSHPASTGSKPQLSNETSAKNEVTSFFDEVPEDAIGAVYVKVDELYVRSIPSTEGNTPIRFAEKDAVYYVFEMYQDDKYTWYKIGENEWIADQNKEWAEFFQDLD